VQITGYNLVIADMGGVIYHLPESHVLNHFHRYFGFWCPELRVILIQGQEYDQVLPMKVHTKAGPPPS